MIFLLLIALVVFLVVWIALTEKKLPERERPERAEPCDLGEALHTMGGPPPMRDDYPRRES